jgi:hypothetical protein
VKGTVTPPPARVATRSAPRSASLPIAIALKVAPVGSARRTAR